jgi:hypothetical protein
MSVAIRWIFNKGLAGGLFVSCIAFNITANMGCASSGSAERVVHGPATKVFAASYEQTWRAAQKAMVNYPIRVNNIDSGLIESEVIKGQELWPAPHKERRKQPGLRYQITLRATKGNSGQNEATSVSIQKKSALEKDFFSGESQLPSDGSEEEMLMYRIDREIILENALDKAYKQNKI